MSEKRKKLKEKLHKKYRIVIYNYDTHEERFHFRLTRINAIGIVIVSMLLLIILTTYIIAFTPLREYIPGYTDVSLNKRVYEMERRADSLEIIFQQN